MYVLGSHTLLGTDDGDFWREGVALYAQFNPIGATCLQSEQAQNRSQEI